VVILTAACGGAADPFVRGILDRTTPDGGRVTDYSGVIRNSAGIEASWTVETDMTWDRYAQWVTARLSPGLESVGRGATSRAFRKSLNADTYMIFLENVPGQRRTKVRITVEGRPQ
jgi:hypothetical protein